MITLIDFSIGSGPALGFWIDLPTADFDTAVGLATALAQGYILAGQTASVQSVQRAAPRRGIVWHPAALALKLAELRLAPRAELKGVV